ncbi:hypothetical protein [Microbacterium testaceum]|uniref:hypothetical protein n=1 Tax=Microbacterium testaceum TaxID=2033 RepID=UPI0015E16522|nr:hypothetical protein [Microbacterium testaceum]
MEAQAVILSLFGIIIGVGVAFVLIFFAVREAVTEGMKRYWKWRVAEDAKQRAQTH